MNSVSLVLPLWAPWLLGLVLSVAIERAALPRPVSLLKRPWQALLVHVGLWTIFFGLMLLVFQRPWFGALNLLAFMFLLIEIGNIKWVMLREPFIYPDFEYFSDTVKYPRLYLPFFGVRNAVLATLGYGLALAFGLYVEPALDVSGLSWVVGLFPGDMPGSWAGRALQLMALTAAFVVAGVVLIVVVGRKPVPVSFDAGRDQHELGFLYFLWRYRQEEGVRPPVDAHAPFGRLLAQARTAGVKANTDSGVEAGPDAGTGAGAGTDSEVATGPEIGMGPGVGTGSAAGTASGAGVRQGATPLVYAQASKESDTAPGAKVTAGHKVPAARAGGGAAAVAGAPGLPDLVMLQCESFFDLRRTFATARPEMLAAFDTLRDQAQGQGRLHVPAWGANTVRTEYAVISGVDPEKLGVHRYNPYRRYARHAVPTVASYLRSLGYKTLCVHPYVAQFYRRTQTMPAMGFDLFLGQEAFADAKRFGPYISDEAVADKIAALLAAEARQGTQQPLFIYAITMENHGPLNWETVGADEQNNYFTQPLPPQCDDLVAYARHIANADHMMGAVSGTLNRLGRPAAMCVFGDHVPIMPAVYASLGQPDGTTDYVCWANDVLRGSAACPRGGWSQDLAAHELGLAYLKGVGLA